MYILLSGFPGGSDGKESTCNARDLGSIPGSRRSPQGGHGNPCQYSSLENPHGQRSLAGYSPWVQIVGETMETVADFIFLYSKITADGDCSHEIKKRLLFGRKAMTKLPKEVVGDSPP